MKDLKENARIERNERKFNIWLRFLGIFKGLIQFVNINPYVFGIFFKRELLMLLFAQSIFTRLQLAPGSCITFSANALNIGCSDEYAFAHVYCFWIKRRPQWRQ